MILIEFLEILYFAGYSTHLCIVRRYQYLYQKTQIVRTGGWYAPVDSEYLHSHFGVCVWYVFITQGIQNVV